MMEFVMILTTMKCVALMVEIVVTTSQDGMLGARIADARRNAKMAHMVPVLIGVLKILFQKILVMQLAAHLAELVCLVDIFGKGNDFCTQIKNNGLCDKTDASCGKESCGDL